MCGIFGVFGANKAAELAMMGLHGIQHRATEFAGIATTDGTYLYRHAGPGLARQVFKDQKTLDRLHGRHALGHIRYGTSQKTRDDEYRDNTQPILGYYGGTQFALAHNGNLPDTQDLQKKLGRSLMTTMDSEYLVRLLEKWQTGNIVADLRRLMTALRGSYALCLLFPDKMVAVQDPTHCRPLSLGTYEDGYFICSESCGFDGVDAKFERELFPGEILVIEAPNGPRSWPAPESKLRHCLFELNYFSHPASQVFGRNVEDYRLALGKALEEYCPAHGADIVTPVPDSANLIAKGFSSTGRSGAYQMLMWRSHYVGRSFIEESQVERDTTVANKFTFAPRAIEGKKVVVVDDSIVRGTTTRRIVRKLRQYGAKEVHLRIATPPIEHPCRYGIDTPTYEELISAGKTPVQIREELGADSLLFLPLEVQKKLTAAPKDFCFACMDGQYWH